MKRNKWPVMIALMFRLTISCDILSFFYCDYLSLKMYYITLFFLKKKKKHCTHYSKCESVLTASVWHPVFLFNPFEIHGLFCPLQKSFLSRCRGFLIHFRFLFKWGTTQIKSKKENQQNYRIKFFLSLQIKNAKLKKIGIKTKTWFEPWLLFPTFHYFIVRHLVNVQG